MCVWVVVVFLDTAAKSALHLSFIREMKVQRYRKIPFRLVSPDSPRSSIENKFVREEDWIISSHMHAFFFMERIQYVGSGRKKKIIVREEDGREI